MADGEKIKPEVHRIRFDVQIFKKKTKNKIFEWFLALDCDFDSYCPVRIEWPW